MLSDKTKELIGTVAGVYVGYRVANRLFPFFVILFLIGMFLNIGQCTYNKITGASPVVEQPIDRAVRSPQRPPTPNHDGQASTPPATESRYERESNQSNETEEHDLIGKIETALKLRDFCQARKLLKRFTTVTGEECESATIAADQGYIATAVVRLERVIHDLYRLQEVLARSERAFRGKNAFVRKLEEATNMLKKLVKEMKEAKRTG